MGGGGGTAAAAALGRRRSLGSVATGSGPRLLKGRPWLGEGGDGRRWLGIGLPSSAAARAAKAAAAWAGLARLGPWLSRAWVFLKQFCCA